MQNPNVKKTAAPLTFKQQVKHYTEELLRFLFGLSVSLGRGTEVARNNFNLGLRHLSLGNYGDAIFRFKAVTWMEPQNAQAWYQLGTAYLADRRAVTAGNCYRKALSLQPEFEEASYMLAIARGSRATPEELPKKIPLSLVLAHFEPLAATYDKEQVETYGYKGHLLLADAVRAAATAGRVDYAVLDLGVGTGLIVPPLRPIVSQATGVDISSAMLVEAGKAKDAQSKRAYDSLIKNDAISFLKEAPAAEYDMIVAGLLFSFVGELDEMFRLITTALKPGGIFAFTADILNGEGYKLDSQAGRFRFSMPYLEQLARTNGLTQIRMEQADVYPDQKMWLAVFRK